MIDQKRAKLTAAPADSCPSCADVGVGTTIVPVTDVKSELTSAAPAQFSLYARNVLFVSIPSCLRFIGGPSTCLMGLEECVRARSEDEDEDADADEDEARLASRDSRRFCVHFAPRARLALRRAVRRVVDFMVGCAWVLMTGWRWMWMEFCCPIFSLERPSKFLASLREDWATCR